MLNERAVVLQRSLQMTSLPSVIQDLAQAGTEPVDVLTPGLHLAAASTGPDVKSLQPGTDRLANGHGSRRRPVATVIQRDKETIRRLFESGEYPYKTGLRTADYEQHKAELQVELLKAQDWLRSSGQKVVILFEGRDAAGKGGTIHRFM
jgi:hypothetical protein